MIHQLLTTEYLFWLVAFAFYLLENIKLVSKSQILISETLTGRFKPSFSFNTFEIKGQEVHLLNLFTPYTGFFRLSATPNDSPSSNYEETREQLESFQKAVAPFKLISIISFAYLLLGPVLTFYNGLGITLLFLLPLHLITLLFLLGLLLMMKNKLGFGYGAISSLFFDCLVVPAYLPNIVRKIYGKKVFSCDGYYFLLKTTSERNREELHYNISRKLNQLIDHLDDSYHEKFESYQKLLGVKNDQQ